MAQTVSRFLRSISGQKIRSSVHPRKRILAYLLSLPLAKGPSRLREWTQIQALQGRGTYCKAISARSIKELRLRISWTVSQLRVWRTDQVQYNMDQFQLTRTVYRVLVSPPTLWTFSKWPAFSTSLALWRIAATTWRVISFSVCARH